MYFSVICHSCKSRKYLPDDLHDNLPDHLHDVYADFSHHHCMTILMVFWRNIKILFIASLVIVDQLVNYIQFFQFKFN